MREKNPHNLIEEQREQTRVDRRHKKKNLKMKMTGKGMKRFANPKKSP